MSSIKRIHEFAEELRGLSATEFMSLITETIKRDGRFQNIEAPRDSFDLFFDLFADKISDTRSLRVGFQVKRLDLITPDIVTYIGSYISRAASPSIELLYLITDGTVTEEAKKIAADFRIELWDIYTLFRLVPEDLKDQMLGYGTNELSDTTKEENLSTALIQLAPGKLEWSTYQLLVNDILTHLFCPPLFPPRYELPDADRKNRRDIIFENSIEHPFWKSLKQTYKADYIVVDAKNNDDPIGKDEVLGIAHYLKPYGCGMFGILMTRKGASVAASHAIKEQWIGSGKMIVVLDDAAVLEMLSLKQANGKVEEIIRSKIADFRMAL